MASERAASRRSPPFIDPPGYAQHRPEQTLLYRLVEQHYPVFLALRFLLATNPEALTRVLGIVYGTISSHLLRKARLTRAVGATGAVTLIQRFGSALNLNIHSTQSSSASAARRRLSRRRLWRSVLCASSLSGMSRCLSRFYRAWIVEWCDTVWRMNEVVSLVMLGNSTCDYHCARNHEHLPQWRSHRWPGARR